MKPYLVMDETTGAWLKGRDPRSECYNHSTFADLLITGLIGLRPRADDTIIVQPLLPADTWSWFKLERVRYHGRELSITWDRDGSRYGLGAGLHVRADGRPVVSAERLEPVSGKMP